MIERVRSWTGRDLALFGLTEGALLAFASTPTGRPLVVLAVLNVVALFVRLRPLPAKAAQAIERGSWVLLFLTGVLALGATVFPLLPAFVTSLLPRLLGYALAFLCVVFVAGRQQWDPLRGAAPAAVGLFVVAAVDPQVALPFPLALAGVSIVVGLAIQGGPGVPRRLFRVALSALLAGGLAVGISRFLPWAQPQVEMVTARMVSGPTAESGFSLDSRLGDVGELTLSQRVLMHVTTNTAAKLRARVFVRFDGRSWRPDASAAAPFLAETGEIGGALGSWLDGVPGQLFAVPGIPLDAAWRSDAVKTRVIQVAPVIGALPAPARPLLIRRVDPVLVDGFGVLGPPSRGLETYGVVSLPADRPRPGADEDPDPEWLAVPPDTDRRFADLASRLEAAGGASPEARLARTLAHVQSECRYSLKPGAFRSAQPAAEFLFEKKKGYCEYFATATAVLLRLQGIPTRYVRGFTVREANHIGGHYVVREADAHAWLEVRMPGRGWVEADPTPAGEYDAAHGGVSRRGLDAFLTWLSSRWLELRALFDARAGYTIAMRLLEVAKSLVRGRPAIVTFSLAFLAGVWLFRRIWPILRRLRQRQKIRRRAALPAAAPELYALLLKTDRLWARHGRRRPVFRAPQEHLASLEDSRMPRPVLEGTRRVVEAYYRGRFAGHPVTAGEVRQLDRMLEKIATGKGRGR